MDYKRIFLVCTLMLTVSALHAEEKKVLSCPDKPDREAKARKLAGSLFADAEEAYESGRYQQSLMLFLCSMNMVEHPNTVINIEKTLNKFEDQATALPLLREYIALAPEGELTEKISTIEKRIDDAVRRAAEPVCDCPEPKPVKIECPTEGDDGCDEAKAETTSAKRILQITGWADVGLGAGAFITAIVLQGLAGSHKNQAQNAETYDEFLDAKDKKRSFQISATTMFLTSALLAGTGLVHLFLLSREHKTKSSETTPPRDADKAGKAKISLVPGPAYLGIEGFF